MVKLLVGPGNTGSASSPSTSPGIGIEVWMPSPPTWNERIHVKGGLGWQGTAEASLTELAGIGQTDTPAMIAGVEGAVSATTDTGHSYASMGGSFAMNADGTINQALWNDFSYRSVHEMAVKTKALTLAYYGKPQRYAYFDGWSTGGRQGLMEAQVFPGDFDGILAGAPAVYFTSLLTAGLYPQIVTKRDLGSSMSRGQLALASNAAIGFCDRVNGLHLGFILDPLACSYDPTTDPSVICQQNGGSNATADCITPSQASSINKVWYGLTTDGTSPSPSVDTGNSLTFIGAHKWYGPVRGTELSGIASSSAFSMSTDMIALELQNSKYANANFINAVSNGTGLWENLNYADLSAAFDRGIALQPLFGSVNTDNPDLSSFKGRGGKIISYHGLADAIVPPQGTIYYYNEVSKVMGGINAVRDFFKLYLVPGLGHGGTNGTSNGSANPPLPGDGQLYRVLVDWVEKGSSPDQIDIKSPDSSNSMPICPYPRKVSYVSGPINVATSYSCS